MDEAPKFIENPVEDHTETFEDNLSDFDNEASLAVCKPMEFGPKILDTEKRNEGLFLYVCQEDEKTAK